MHPEIEERNLVIGAPVDAKDPIKEDVPYIVITKLDRVTVKYLELGKGEQEVILHGANKDYVRPYKVAMDNISKLYEVRKVVWRV